VFDLKIIGGTVVDGTGAKRYHADIGIKDGNPLVVVEQLENLGIPVFAVNPVDLESVILSIEAISDPQD